ncbi:MAG: hypothetical protein U5K54_24450 [Cytophagales bacterium]|nr:hypothetical protein [Cytophagales bacterium]
MYFPNLTFAENLEKRGIALYGISNGSAQFNGWLKYTSFDDLLIAASTRPSEPMVTEAEWNLIVDYFGKKSPDTLNQESKRTFPTLTLFNPYEIKNAEESTPAITDGERLIRYSIKYLRVVVPED